MSRELVHKVAKLWVVPFHLQSEIPQDRFAIFPPLLAIQAAQRQLESPLRLEPPFARPAGDESPCYDSRGWRPGIGPTPHGPRPSNSSKRTRSCPTPLRLGARSARGPTVPACWARGGSSRRTASRQSG